MTRGGGGRKLFYRSIDFEEELVDKGNEKQVKVLFLRSGIKTFPQIFSGDKLIEGCSYLVELDKKDKLGSLKKE